METIGKAEVAEKNSSGQTVEVPKREAPQVMSLQKGDRLQYLLRFRWTPFLVPWWVFS